jgi:hypothetical protein
MQHGDGVPDVPLNIMKAEDSITPEKLQKLDRDPRRHLAGFDFRQRLQVDSGMVVIAGPARPPAQRPACFNVSKNVDKAVPDGLVADDFLASLHP